MNTELMNTIAAANDKAQYDACAKRLIGQKVILAHILIRTVDEFKGMQPEEAVAYIEGEPLIGIVPVNPGMTNTGRIKERTILTESIKGLNTEDSEINEGTIRFDIIFYVRMKDGLAQMIINIEIQKDQPADYHLLNRSIYYVSRMISSQKGRDFVKSKYNDLKRVFNIWICLDMNENSLSRYYLANENILGECHWKGKQDLINIIFIGLTKDLPERDKKYELHRLLNALLSDKIKVQEKIEVIENEYHILMNDDLRRDVNIMCNLGEGIEERAIKETTERVTKKVTEEVTREVTEEMTEQFIRSMYDKGCSIELIADVARKSIAEVKAILDKAILSV